MVEPRDEWVVIQWWVNPRCKFEAHINLYDLEESFWQQSTTKLSSINIIQS